MAIKAQTSSKSQSRLSGDLPQRRKEPRQTRSQILVESIKQACKSILEEQGAQALSVNNLVEKAGVEIGSLYQYYPNIDAVVGEICRDEVIKHLNAQILAMSHMEEATPEQFLRHLVITVIEFHRRLLAYDRKFFTQYKTSFKLSEHYNQLLQDPEASKNSYHRFLSNSLPQHHFEVAVFLIDNCIDGLIEKAIAEYPEYLEEPAFADYIYTMCNSLLQSHSR